MQKAPYLKNREEASIAPCHCFCQGKKIPWEKNSANVWGSHKSLCMPSGTSPCIVTDTVAGFWPGSNAARGQGAHVPHPWCSQQSCVIFISISWHNLLCKWTIRTARLFWILLFSSLFTSCPHGRKITHQKDLGEVRTSFSPRFALPNNYGNCCAHKKHRGNVQYFSFLVGSGRWWVWLIKAPKQTNWYLWWMVICTNSSIHSMILPCLTLTSKNMNDSLVFD